MYSRFVKSEGEEGERTQAGGNLCISAYLEVVITVSGFIFPCITGCDGPLGRVWHGSAINNITNVQNQHEKSMRRAHKHREIGQKIEARDSNRRQRAREKTR